MNQNSCIGRSLSLCNAFVNQGSILAKVFSQEDVKTSPDPGSKKGIHEYKKLSFN